jgi:hypothetical protein
MSPIAECGVSMASLLWAYRPSLYLIAHVETMPDHVADGDLMPAIHRGGVVAIGRRTIGGKARS